MSLPPRGRGAALPPIARPGLPEMAWMLLCALGAGGALLGNGAVAGLFAGLSVAACCGACLFRGAKGQGAQAAADEAAFTGARLMLAEVVPVWRRQLETTRRTADDGFQNLSGAFSEVVSGLSALIDGTEQTGSTVRAGSLNTLLDARPDLLAELVGPVTTAQQRVAEVSKAVDASAAAVKGLCRGTRELKGFARHTRLVSMNAAIEANRAPPELRAGLGAIAQEIRELADTAGRLASEFEGRAQVIDEQLTPLQDGLGSSTPGEDETAASVRLAAYRTVGGLLGDLSRSLEASQGSREQAERLREKFEDLLLSVQVGDRVNQMLDILGADLDRLVEWNLVQGTARKADAVAWLEALSQRYTTDEQRQQHHGTVAIERQAEVEFF